MDRGLRFARLLGRAVVGVVFCLGIGVATGDPLSAAARSGGGLCHGPSEPDPVFDAWARIVRASPGGAGLREVVGGSTDWLEDSGGSFGDGRSGGGGADQVVPVVLLVATGSPDAGEGLWDDAFPTIEAALQVGQQLGGPVQVWVAAGTYVPGGPDGSANDSFVLFNGVELLGGFAGFETDASQRDPVANQTVLSGWRPAPAPSARRVVRHEGFFNNATIDGFVIRDGNANGTGDDRFGGGVWVKNASLTVRNCLFIGNNAIRDGGGLYTTGSAGTIVVESCVFGGNNGEGGGGARLANGGTVRDCVFMGNTALFGGGLSVGGTALISGCVFENNFAQEGGGIYVFNGTTGVRWCSFAGNFASSGGGLRFTFGSGHVVMNSSFVQNAAEDGGAIHATAPVRVVNALIAWNNAFKRGGAIYFDVMDAALLDVRHATIWSNKALQFGGGIYAFRGNVSAANSVLYKNTAALGSLVDWQIGISAAQFGTVSARYCCIEGVGPGGAPSLGPANFGDWPEFTSPLGPDGIPGTGDEDFTPLPGSPLRDRAEDASVPQDTLDVDDDGNTAELVPLDLLGNPRARVSALVLVPPAASQLRVDIGAVEGSDLCLLDLNGDGVIDADDLGILLGSFGSVGVELPGDINWDGGVDADDLGLLLGGFGAAC